MDELTPGLAEALNCPLEKDNFLPTNAADRPAPLDWPATPSQILGLKRLNDLANVFVRLGTEPRAGYQPLTKSLLIGESGSGKSRLAREFAKAMDWPFLVIDCGSWIPQGATTKPSTLQVVRDYLRKSAGAFSVLYLDELCKLLPVGTESSSAWNLGCWSEFLALGDCDSRLKSHEFTKTDIQLLRDSCYLIAGGAFTGALKEFRAGSKRGGLGFGAGETFSSPLTYSSKIHEQLPEEIASRFHPAHIVLERPTREDYAVAVERIHTDLKVPRSRPIKELLDEAVACPGGMRWVEAYLTEVLVANPGCLPEERDEWIPQSAEAFDFFGGDYVHYAREVTKAAFQLRGLLARMLAEIAIFKQAGERVADEKFNQFLFGKEEDLQTKLLRTLAASNACGTVQANDSKALDPILGWRTTSWTGLVWFPTELARYGLLESFAKSWDLASRVSELRYKLSKRVATGRVGGGS